MVTLLCKSKKKMRFLWWGYCWFCFCCAVFASVHNDTLHCTLATMTFPIAWACDARDTLETVCGPGHLYLILHEGWA